MGCGVGLSIKLSDGRDVESLGAVEYDVRSTFRYPRPLLSVFVTECVQTFQRRLCQVMDCEDESQGWYEISFVDSQFMFIPHKF